MDVNGTGARKFHSETIGDATLYLADCHEIMPTLGKFDALVTDPPYGIGEAAGKSRSRRTTPNAKWRHRSAKDYGIDAWDDAADHAGIQIARSLSQHQIIFGGNYYTLPPTSCWLVWDKLNGNSDFADCELAWTNLKSAVRRIQWTWNGFQKRGEPYARVHPTQKPIGVMTWCIERLPADVEIIFDPYMGSGTTGIAAHKSGKKFIGIEREQKHFDAACERIADAQKQPDLFIEKPAKTFEQCSLGLGE